jgi:hypothetical protein
VRMIPCPECGKPRESRKLQYPNRPCRLCRSKAFHAAKEQQRIDAEIDAAIIDWAAIEWVAQGCAAILTPRERKLAVRRLAHRLIDQAWNVNDIPAGRLTAAQLGALMGCTDAAVIQTRRRLPPAERRRCPECGGVMFVLAGGVVEEHGDGFHERCAMSDRLVPRGLAAVRPDLYPWLVGRTKASEQGVSA